MTSAEERLKGIEPLEILQLCKDFLGNKWSAVTEDNFDFKVITKGFGNRLFVCGVNDAAEDAIEPRKVLVRFYGGNKIPKDIYLRTLTEAGEVLTFYCLNQCGLGPKLHGVFKDGRIEEYIPSTSFTMAEFCEDLQVNEAIARVLARFHAVDIPVRKCPSNPIQLMKEQLSKYVASKDNLPPLPAPKSDDEAEEWAELLSFDDTLAEEIAWLEKIMPLIESPIVFAHNDSNRSNMLVRLDDGSNQPLDQRLFLIDYEFNGYNHRGADIASHFYVKVFDLGSNEPITGRPYPSEAQRRHFIASYLDECKKIPAYAENWDENGGDSGEHVLLESAFYALINELLAHSWMMNGRADFSGKEQDVDDDIWGGPALFVRFYKERKEQFLERYPQYA